MSKRTDNKQRIRVACERHTHRIRGLMMNLAEIIDETETRAKEGEANWGTQQEMQDLEKALASYISAYRYPLKFNADEAAAIEQVLADVYPEAQPYFAV